MSKKATAEEKAARTAALLRQQRAERRRNLFVVVSIMAVLAVIAGVGAWLLRKYDEPDPTAKASDYSLVVGPEDAPTTIVIYEDFLCPACGYAEVETHEQIAAAVAAGKVRAEYRPVNYLKTDYSERAANAFRAVWVQAGPEAAKKMHDLLFAQQPEEQGPYPDDDWLVDQAVAAGADEDQIRPAIEDRAYLEWVTEATADASGIRGTPTVYLNNKLVEEPVMRDLVATVLAATE